MYKAIDHLNLLDFVANRHTVVVGGYSDQGYEDIGRLRQHARQLLEEAIEEHGDNLLYVSGATEVGIGCVYEDAKALGIATLGVVSECADDDNISTYCDWVSKVPDPECLWKVVSPTGYSYFVEIARYGKMYMFGGGEIASDELAEALELGVEAIAITIHAPASTTRIINSGETSYED